MDLGPNGSLVEGFRVTYEGKKAVLMPVRHKSLSATSIAAANVKKDNPDVTIALEWNGIQVPINPGDMAQSIHERVTEMAASKRAQYDASPAGKAEAKKAQQNQENHARAKEAVRKIANASTKYHFPDDLAKYRDDETYNLAIAGMEWLDKGMRASKKYTEKDLREYLNEIRPESGIAISAAMATMRNIIAEGWDAHLENCRDLQNRSR